MKIAYTINEACKALGVGRTTIYAEIAGGRITARKVHKRTLILAEELQRYASELPTAVTRHSDNGEK